MYDPTAMATRKPFPAEFQELHALLDREEDRWTEMRLAMLLETNPATIWRWRTGKNLPDPLKQDAILNRLRAEVRKAARKRPPA